MTRILAVVALLCTTLALPSAAGEAEALSRAMTQMKSGDWGAARDAAGSEGSVP